MAANGYGGIVDDSPKADAASQSQLIDPLGVRKEEHGTR